MSLIQLFPRSVCINVIILVALVFVSRANEPETHIESGAHTTLDESFLLSDLWDDGRGEIALYEIEVVWRVAPTPIEQQVEARTLLVKHLVDRETARKADSGGPQSVSSFQWSTFYRLGGGVRSRIFIARQDDLLPLRQTYTDVSWESDCFREWSFLVKKNVSYELRCTGYHDNEPKISALRQDVFTPLQVPLIVRSMTFADGMKATFPVLVGEGEIRTIAIENLGHDRLKLGKETVAAQKILVDYGADVPSPGGILGLVAAQEVYWRSLLPNRQILQIESRGSKVVEYRMELVSQARCAYWERPMDECLSEQGRSTER